MYDKNNIFAKIIRKEVPCKEIYRDSEVLAFHDISPAAPAHAIVIPIGEYTSFDDFVSKSGSERVGKFFAAVKEIANILGLNKTGYRLITNNGNDAAQSVPHFHVHILGGRNLGGLFGDNA